MVEPVAGSLGRLIPIARGRRGAIDPATRQEHHHEHVADADVADAAIDVNRASCSRVHDDRGTPVRGGVVDVRCRQAAPRETALPFRCAGRLRAAASGGPWRLADRVSASAVQSEEADR